MAERLGNQHMSALIALMVAAREVSNPELQATAGFTITGEVRRRLNEDKLVTSRLRGRSYAHELTEKGWARCGAELGAPVPNRPGPLGAALYVLLGGLGSYLKRTNLRLADIFQEHLAGGLEAQIRMAYLKLARKPNDWVRLADLRSLLNGAAKAEVDGVLKTMSRAGQAHLEPDSNRKTLSEADRAAAVRIGGEDNHLIAIEGS